jgi:creatinine amidohydrolase
MSSGIKLEDLTWVEAEAALTADSIVVIPLGAALKEHGPHLKLKNDLLLADYLKEAVLRSANVLVTPTVPYSFYPAFVEYPGSVSLKLDTARDTIVQIVQSLASFGPHRFYVLNTGVSTIRMLEPAAELLAAQGILLHYANLEKLLGSVIREVSEQEGGTHADEIETSMMLVIAPQTVDMSKAVKDFDKTGKGRLSRNRESGKTYSPTGIWGDASLASVEKGQAVVKSLVSGLIDDIDKLRQAELPPVRESESNRA